MKLKLVIAFLILSSSCGDDDEGQQPNVSAPAIVSGLTLSESNSSFDITYTSLRNTIDTNPNIGIVAEVNHTENATSVGLELNPARIIFFGNPNLGTPLMQENQLAGLDLPQKIVVYQDDNEDVFLGFNSTEYLTARHQLDGVVTLPTINDALTNITATVSGNETIISSSNTNISGELIVTKTSLQSFDETYNALRTTIDNNPNLGIVAEVNHQENASNNGLELRPTRLIIFGNPNLGTPLMQNKITTAIDLPQKMLVWEDENGVVNVSYNDTEFLELRHSIVDNDTNLQTIKMALDTISNSALGL